MQSITLKTDPDNLAQCAKNPLNNLSTHKTVSNYQVKLSSNFLLKMQQLNATTIRKNFLNLYNKFNDEFYKASQFDERSFTIAPTVLYITSCFLHAYLLIYGEIDFINLGRSFKYILLKITMFEGIVYYEMRLWFWVLKTMRWLIKVIEKRLKQLKESHKNTPTTNSTNFNNTAVIFLFVLGILRSLVVYLDAYPRLFPRDENDAFYLERMAGLIPWID